jgi:hypothetical protein
MVLGQYVSTLYSSDRPMYYHHSLSYVRHLSQGPRYAFAYQPQHPGQMLHPRIYIPHFTFLRRRSAQSRFEARFGIGKVIQNLSKVQ